LDNLGVEVGVHLCRFWSIYWC